MRPNEIRDQTFDRIELSWVCFENSWNERPYTDPIESLNIVVVGHYKYIRTQVPSCLCMTWLGLHKSPLGSLVEMSVALTELIFKKKSLRIFLVEID